jgi:hypothetical protein
LGLVSGGLREQAAILFHEALSEGEGVPLSGAQENKTKAFVSTAKEPATDSQYRAGNAA